MTSAAGLPLTLRPTHVHLAIRTELGDTCAFAGESIITIRPEGRFTQVCCHLTKNVALVDAAVQISSGIEWSRLDVARIIRGNETITIPFDDMEPIGAPFKLWFSFHGSLDKAMRGYYLSEGDADPTTGEKPKYSLTQFESTGARRSFPCWDDPNVKCTWNVDLIAEEQYTVLSNMPALSVDAWTPNGRPPYVAPDSYKLGSTLAKPETTEGQWRITRHDTSPLMSPYLVAYACGPFAALESTLASSNGTSVPLRIFTTANLISQARQTLLVTQAALEFYEKLFGIPYMLPKLDTLVAHDFDAGAMENWGLVTGRTSGYLYDETSNQSSIFVKRRLTYLQGHELAHMWFGNLVTMKWWDNLWLKEAFATLLGETVLPENLWPEWKSTGTFLRVHFQKALELDSKTSTHPIQVPCPTTQDIAQIFDAISYSKGASILRMLLHTLGSDTFFAGVSKYLNRFSYGNATTDDLWAALFEASGQDVATLMSDWTLESGYPVLTVEMVDENHFRVSQRRFSSSGDTSTVDTLWKVPLRVRVVSAAGHFSDSMDLLTTKSNVFAVHGQAFKLNADTVGFYRVHYSTACRANIAKNASRFTAEDRLGLLSDTFAFAKSGNLTTSEALDFVQKMTHGERDLSPLSQVASGLQLVAQVWWKEGPELLQSVAALQRSIFEPVLDHLGLIEQSGESLEDKELREICLDTLAKSNSDPTIEFLRGCFDEASNDVTQVPPSLRKAVYTTAGGAGGYDVYRKFVAVYDTSTNPGVKIDAIGGQCATQDSAAIDDIFRRLGEITIKKQDHFLFYGHLARNNLTRERVADHFLSHFEQLSSTFSDGGMRYLVNNALPLLTSLEDIQKINQALESFDVKSCNRALDQCRENIKDSASWLERDRQNVSEWFISHGFLKPSGTALSR